MIETSGDQRNFIVREKLTGQRIVAGLVTLLLGGVVTAMILYYDGRDMFFWIFGSAVAIIALGSLFFLLTAPETETSIDARERTVILKRRSLIGEKSEEFPFDEFAGEALVETIKGTRGSDFVRLVLPRANGEPVPLTSESRYKAGRDLQPVAESINRIIFQRERPSFEVTILEED